MKLIICGNGLDIHLGFNTRYSDYKNYLLNDIHVFGKKNAVNLIETSHFFIDNKAEFWSDLEQSLTFDFDGYVKEYLEAFDRDLEPYDEKKSHDQIKAATEFGKHNPEKIAFDFTNNWFAEWLSREYYGKIDSIKSTYNNVLKKIIVPEDTICITFNYTPSLEDVFNINERDIFYIHNRMPHKPTLPFTSKDFQDEIFELGKKRFQFGSTKNELEKWLDNIKHISLKSKGKLMKTDDLERNLIHIYNCFSKNLEDNYLKLQKFIDREDIEEIIIVGHSFMGIDEPYYKDIIIPMLKSVRWKIYCHNGIISASDFVRKYKIKEYEFIEW